MTINQMKPEQKLEIVTHLYESQTVITASKDYHGRLITKTGIISKKPERCSGVWGYGGDSIAVYIENEPFPSSNVIDALNQ